MFGWGVSLAIAASAAILLAPFIILAVRWCCRFSKQGTKVSEATTTLPQIRANMEGLQSQRMPRPSYNLFRRGPSAKLLFSWGDHPSLIADAIENGWSRFAFTNYSSSSSARSPLLGCVEREPQAEMTWEVGDGSVDFMQKIRMNPGTKRFSSNCSSIAVKSAIRTALPLPGPPMGNPYSFPQEAYFEITLLSVSSSPEDHQIKAEGERTKLIGDKISDGKGNLDALDGELKAGGRAAVMISVGLTSSNLVPLKIPGSYHGSIGFNSDGSIYLDGMKLVFESEKEDWGQEEKVIGCGFDPRQKKVFFTVDSKLVEAVHCKSEEFGIPLYPIIAANVDVTVLVNMGQSRFSYEPANELRTPNPCFVGPLVRSPAALGYEDSGELFSMGRIDSCWHHHCNGNNGSKAEEDDDNDGESEADLFEIVLDVDGKSLNV